MKTLSRRGLFGAAGCIACGTAHLGFSATPVQAQTPAASGGGWRPPEPGQRCPSKWGPNDRRGSMNLMTPERAKKAAGLIRTGEIVELGHVLEARIPTFGPRRFSMHSKQMFMNPEANRRGSNEEIVATEIGQIGTQFDGFPHQTIGNEAYNCVDVPSISSRDGFTEMGIDTVGTVFTRGVLIDVAGLKGVPTLPDDYEITVADIEQSLQRQGNTRVEEGDAVIIHTGWGLLWNRDNPRYVRGCPGIGIPAAQWIIGRNPMLIGADNWPVEVAPNPDRSISLPVHQIALVINGVHLLENMKLDQLAQRRQYEFAFTVQPLKIKGGSGSTVAPSALF
jgi:kynurenine formamidase